MQWGGMNMYNSFPLRCSIKAPFKLSGIQRQNYLPGPFLSCLFPSVVCLIFYAVASFVVFFQLNIANINIVVIASASLLNFTVAVIVSRWLPVTTLFLVILLLLCIFHYDAGT